MEKGIYKITCLVNGVVYIGSTSKSFKGRWQKHKQRLNRQCHENSYIQNAWNKYGEDNFLFECVEEMNDASCEDIRSREQYWISIYLVKGRNYCFNFSDVAGGGNTIKTEEDRKKLSDAVKASYTDELREVRRRAALDNNSVVHMRAKVNTPEWKKAHLEGVRRLAKDETWLAKMREVNKSRQVKVGSDRGEVFDSVAEAARSTGANRANIRACIKGKINTCSGRKWFYIQEEPVQQAPVM